MLWIANVVETAVLTGAAADPNIEKNITIVIVILQTMHLNGLGCL